MAFDMITKRRMFEELWDRAGKRQPAPSLRRIVKFARLSDEAAAERLLRDMEADGAITVVGDVGEYPWLTIRRSTYTGNFVSAPVWLEREKAARVAIEPEMEEAPPVFVPIPEYVAPQPINEMPERPEVETVEAQQECHADGQPDPVSVDQGPRLERPPSQAAEEPIAPVKAAPQAVEARQPRSRIAERIEARRREFESQRADFISKPKLFSETGKQVNMRLPAEIFDALSAQATKNGLTPGGQARRIFLEAFTAAECDTGRRHRLSAKVQRAWRDDGRSLDAFVTDLIGLGLDAYLSFRNQAEAAE